MTYFVKDCTYLVSRIKFFEEWLSHAKHERCKELLLYISQKFDLSDITEESTRDLQVKLASLSKKFEVKWYSCGKSKSRFLTKNTEFLKFKVKLLVRKHIPLPSTSSERYKMVGRPKKHMEIASYKTKKRRVHDLIKTRSVVELKTAAEIALRFAGSRKAAKVIKNTTNSEFKESEQCAEQSQMRSLTSDEALAYFVDTRLTSNSYKRTRKWALKVGHEIFPAYYSSAKSKKACCPPDEDILISETRIEIKLQSVIDHTTIRILELQRDVVRELSPAHSLTLISKWGCDGSSGHSTYKQKFSNYVDSDEFLFVFSFVPIQLKYGNKVIWQNPRPSSTMYCRPIKLIFSKETTEFTLEESNKVLNDISQLNLTKYYTNGNEISVEHKMLFTMVDGKVCNALTETRSPQKCYICGATPKEMNDIKVFSSNKENYGFGLSTLHAWIRCFECLLLISYRLDIKKWQIRHDCDKIIVRQRSNDIKARFKRDMGLIIDKPKLSCGSSNDENTARRFFHNTKLSAEITGLNENLIYNLKIILITLSSGFDINVTHFQNFAEETRKLYIKHYFWYYMPTILHKILIHGAEVINSSLLPIGQLSEEAQEARNKDCRRFRQNHTRKNSREATNRDLLTMLLITSDPIISKHISS